MMNW